MKDWASYNKKVETSWCSTDCCKARLGFWQILNIFIFTYMYMFIIVFINLSRQFYQRRLLRLPWKPPSRQLCQRFPWKLHPWLSCTMLRHLTWLVILYLIMSVLFPTTWIVYLHFAIQKKIMWTAIIQRRLSSMMRQDDSL